MKAERSLVGLLVGRGLSERRACRSLAAKRSSMRYQGRPESPLNAELRAELRALARRYRRYGAPRMSAIFNQRYGVNHKRVERLWQEEGLPLPKKARRRRPTTPQWERPAPAQAPNEAWSLDFVHERTQLGQKLKMLTVIDEFTRECLEIRVEKQMKHETVLETLDELIQERGTPRYLRSDNGAEFVAKPLELWLFERGICPVRIEPGSPWQNGFIESFNGKFRDECLNQELFFSRGEAQVIVDSWREEYNGERPHSALGYLTPLEIVARHGQTNIQTGRN